MKKLFFLVGTCFVLFSCSKNESPPILPVAKFETEETFYDDGDTIRFINKSENADSYFWTFGNRMSSNEENPEFVVDLKGSLCYQFRAVLTAHSENGLKTNFSQNFIISRRFLLDLHILKMEQRLNDLIAHAGDQPMLIIYMGPVSDPYEWIIPEQTIPPWKMDTGSGYPQKIYVMRTWHTIAMNNETWFIRFSVQPEGEAADSRIFIKEFEFNPSKADFIMNDNGIRQFVVEDDEMSIAVDFVYC